MKENMLSALNEMHWDWFVVENVERKRESEKRKCGGGGGHRD